MISHFLWKLNHVSLSIFIYILNGSKSHAQVTMPPGQIFSSGSTKQEIPYSDFQEFNRFSTQNLCNHSSNSSFTFDGHGGLPPIPNQDLNSEAIQVGLVYTVSKVQKGALDLKNKAILAQKSVSVQHSTDKKIVSAQGWVYNNNGEVFLVKYNPALKSTQRLKPIRMSYTVKSKIQFTKILGFTV